MTEHAKLSASGAYRWLICTPSAVLEADLPDTQSDAAAEGTLAHKIGELFIRNMVGRVSDAAKIDCMKNFSKNKFFNADLETHAQDYACYVVSEFEKSKTKTPDAILDVEARLDMTEFIPEGFGTGDAVIIADGVLRIIDLKYGKGVMVSCIENKQMMLYALGALKAYDFLYDIQRVEMTIYQPRLENISTWGIDVVNLRNWAENYLRPRADMAFEGKGEFLAGDHCKFCKIKNQCRALAEANLEIEKYKSANKDLLTDDEIADILSRSDAFINWINGITSWAADEAINNGKKWPGFKLVEGRSNRTFSDETKVVETLTNEGYPETSIFAPRKILGITAMEKEVGKKNFETLLSEFIVKPQGKPTLVPVDDKRPELNASARAEEVFKDVEI